MVNCKICSNPVQILPPHYFQCNTCGFIFTNQVLTKPEQKQRYLLHNNDFSNKGYVDMFKDFIKRAIAPIKPNLKTCLDFGSGPTPVLASLLKAEGIDVDIYDIFFSPKKPKRKYDLITATEVLEHLEDPLATMHELKNLLNPDGCIAIMTLFYKGNWENWWYKTDPTHISFFTKDTMRYLAKLLKLRLTFIDERNICIMERLTL